MSQKNDVKKVTIVEFHPTQCPLEETKEETKEENKEQIPEEPPSDSSESSEESTVGENEDYLDVEDLILYLVKIRKSKKLTELLVSELFELIKNKAGLLFARDYTDVIINNYISEIMCFSERLMELSGEVKKLAEISDGVEPKNK